MGVHVQHFQLKIGPGPIEIDFAKKFHLETVLKLQISSHVYNLAFMALWTSPHTKALMPALTVSAPASFSINSK
jgi:hypothetical protein